VRSPASPSSCWHSRDADVFADRYDVPVSVPDWMGRVEQRIDAPLERYSGSFPDSSIRAIPNRPFSIWDEMVLSHEASGTLIVPDSLGTIDSFPVGAERLGLQLLRRLRPPRQLNDLEPERVLVGHGTGITEEQERCPSGSAQVASETGSTSARRKRSCDPPEYHQNGRLNAVRLRPVTCRRLSPTR